MKRSYCKNRTKVTNIKIYCRVVATCQTLGLWFCQLFGGENKKVKYPTSNHYSYTCFGNKSTTCAEKNSKKSKGVSNALTLSN